MLQYRYHNIGGIAEVTSTVVDKLKLNRYEKAAILDAPEGLNYFEGKSEYDTSLQDQPYDLIFAFVLDLASLKSLVQNVMDRQLLNKNGYLYTAYPKKGNKTYPTHIHRDELFPGLGADEDGYIGASDLKFARMVGLDETFTIVGFKLEPRKGQTASAPSQRVDDYVDFIPNIEQDLADAPDLLAMYQSLTPGYRKDWARHVYSAKQETTRDKRREEMKMILRAGYKTRELYRKGTS
jgi:hypothetical protein